MIFTVKEWKEERSCRLGTTDIIRENPVKIDCYLSQGCGSEQALRANINRALINEKVEADVTFNVIDDVKALALGLSGSPSVFVNGREIQPQETVGFS